MKGLFSILASKPIFAIEPSVGISLLQYGLMVAQGTAKWDPMQANIQQQSGSAQSRTGTEEKAVFVQEIRGTLMGEDQLCGPMGYRSLARRMERLAYDDQIGAVMLDITSYGGQVLGLEELVNSLQLLKSKKPIIAHVNGAADSAAYRIAAQSDQIRLSGNESEVGSIGALIQYLDFTRHMENLGIDEVTIISSLSPEKVRYNFSRPSENDIKLIQSDLLDPLVLQFQEEVKEARPNLDVAAFSGQTWAGQSAIDMGLADVISPYLESLSFTADLANEKSSVSMFTKKKVKTNEGKSPEDIQAAHAAAITALEATHAAAITALEGTHAAAIAALEATHATAITDLQGQVDQLSAQVKTLEAAPVNKIADKDGDAKPPKGDALQKDAPIWAGFGEERKTKILDA